MYLQGRGVTQNYTEAARLLQKASDQGNTNAMYTLAVMYANGQGFAKDIGRAKALFSEACQRGNTDACASLKLY